MMKLWLYLALLSIVYAGGAEDIKGSVSDIKQCGTSLYKVECDFTAKTDRRRRLGGGGGNPKDVFSKCSVTEDGIKLVAGSQFTQSAAEDCALDFTNDQVNGDKFKLHIYATTLDVLDGPKAEFMLKVKEAEDSNNPGTYLSSYSDFKIGWTDCN